MPFPTTIRSKLPNTGVSIFSKMSALATEHDAINLSQGFPDFGPPKKLVELVYEHMKAGANQYAPMPGLPLLREKLADKMQDLYGSQINPDTEVTITAGATQALYTAISALVSEGDEVIIFQPAYDCYAPAVLMAGGQPVFVDLEFPDFSIPWEQVKKVIGPRTRMIILNTPQNPTGAVMDADDMAELDKLTGESDIVILSDEVYEHVIFEGQEHQSVLRHPSLRERSLAVFSFGKTYHNTGWKLGYCIGAADLMAEFRKVHQFLVFAVNMPMQQAFADFLDERDWYLELSDFYQTKRDIFNAAVGASRFATRPSLGTYFQLLSYDGVSDESDVDFAERLTTDHGLASIPISVFYHQSVDNKLLRFCFAKEKETLERGAEVLAEL